MATDAPEEVGKSAVLIGSLGAALLAVVAGGLVLWAWNLEGEAEDVAANAARIQAAAGAVALVATGALLLVTALYVRETARMSSIAERSRRQAADSLEEAVRSRLDAATPVVLGWWSADMVGLRQPDGSMPGGVPSDLFDASSYRLRLAIRVHNYGPGPALIQPDDIGPSGFVADDGLPRPLVEGDSTTLIWSRASTGVDLRSYFGRPLPELSFRTWSPLTRVVDQHRWKGGYVDPLPEVPGGGTPLTRANNVAAHGPAWAEQERRYPAEIAGGGE